MARRAYGRGFAAACAGLALCLSMGTVWSFAQDQYPPQDQGPPQYPQAPQQGQDPQQGQYPPQGQDPQQGQYPPQGQGPAQYPQQGPAQSPDSVARLSFIQGDVKVLTGGETTFEQAVVNMPVVAGSSLQTGQDGEAEIEFADGSVARLTPNSSLAIARLGQDSVQLQQNSGQDYYELNVGQGHPPFAVRFANGQAVPSANAIFRLNLDNHPEFAVMAGVIQVSGAGMAPVAVSENQSVRFDLGGGAPVTVAQSIPPDSWDQWNQDRDQAIAQEAAQQTSVRDQAGNANDENWNDLDYYGDWYSVDGNNVWVPSGIAPGWDPYGYGYWGFYPAFGYTWISGYPWGWLPFHCGTWNYYPFGWGWVPGGGVRTWVPIAGLRGYPGYFIPGHPVWRRGDRRPLPGRRLLAVDRGPQSRGPWGGDNHFVPQNDRRAVLNVRGQTIAPIARNNVRERAFAGSRGTTPGMRNVLGISGRAPIQYGGGAVVRPQGNFEAGRSPQNAQPNQWPVRQNPQQPQQGSSEIRSRVQTATPTPQQFPQGRVQQNPRSGYASRPMPTPHYSPPPQMPHYSAPAPRPSAPRGGGGGRR
ncbi:MAG TPA: DUF6600 domain-containing protein [Acidobacteriaceae bacterium]|nr:DUF6600 domain-containing protein [Acidobacteriaceae bacterium]